MFSVYHLTAAGRNVTFLRLLSNAYNYIQAGGGSSHVYIISWIHDLETHQWPKELEVFNIPHASLHARNVRHKRYVLNPPPKKLISPSTRKMIRIRIKMQTQTTCICCTWANGIETEIICIQYFSEWLCRARTHQNTHKTHADVPTCAHCANLSKHTDAYPRKHFPSTGTKGWRHGGRNPHCAN